MTRIERLREMGVPLYTARTQRTHTVCQALMAGPGTQAVLTGRIDHLAQDGVNMRLKDETGVIEVEISHADPAIGPILKKGDLVEYKGQIHKRGFLANSLLLLTPSLRPVPESITPDMLKLRNAVLQLTRLFFDERHFLSVDTPTFMATPDLTPALASFETIFRDEAGRTRPFYLQTSPEHYMKRLLAAGYERIYQICRFYRNGERYNEHHPEFTGLEWYEAYADYHQVMKTTEEYLAFLTVSLRATMTVTYQGRSIDLTPPWPKQTVRDAVLVHARLDLHSCQTLSAFSDQAGRQGYEVRADDTWDDLFHRIFVQTVEPALPSDRPVFLTEYPAQLPSLARYVSEDIRYVERFELYIGGLELANAFSELNDPAEQRRRFEADRVRKQKAEGYTGGIDEALLAALEYGMPPSGGIALGLDRLMMIYSDVPTIDPVIPFRDY